MRIEYQNHAHSYSDPRHNSTLFNSHMRVALGVEFEVSLVTCDFEHELKIIVLGHYRQPWKRDLHTDDLHNLNRSPENQLKHTCSPLFVFRNNFPCINIEITFGLTSPTLNTAL